MGQSLAVDLSLDAQQARVNKTKDNENTADNSAQVDHELADWWVLLCYFHGHGCEVEHYQSVNVVRVSCLFLVLSERVAPTAEVMEVIRIGSIHKNVRHQLHELIVVIMLIIWCSGESVLCCFRVFFHQIKHNMLWEVSKPFLNPVHARAGTEHELLEVVIQLHSLEELGFLCLQLPQDVGVLVRADLH